MFKNLVYRLFSFVTLGLLLQNSAIADERKFLLEFYFFEIHDVHPICKNLQGEPSFDLGVLGYCGKPGPIDLSGKNLPSSDFSGLFADDNSKISFSSANLDGTNFTGASSEDYADVLDFEKASLISSTFYRARLNNVSFDRANITKSNLSQGSFRFSNFSRIEGLDADFSLANLEYANFDSANLTQAIFVNANLNSNSFKNANLRSVWMNGLYLSESDFTNANLTYARLKGSNLRGTKLVGADLNNAQLDEADLSGADMTGARAEGASLRGAIFTRNPSSGGTILPFSEEFALAKGMKCREVRDAKYQDCIVN